MNRLPENIYIGTAGWNYKDWYGIVYPEPPPKGFQELEFIAGIFNTVEVNSSFYHPTRPSVSEAWVRKVSGNPEFIFTVKIWQRFTHQRQPYGSEEVTLYRNGIDPLARAGKLGCCLLQFPWSFKDGEGERKWLTGLFQDFSDYPLVVELRHGSWDNPSTLEFLDKNRVGLATIDQPVIGNSIPPKPVLTGSVGYVRLHGRNYKSWFPSTKDRNENPSSRYDYLYSSEEIGKWALKVDQVAEKAARTFVIQNNHPWGQAVANSLQLQAALGHAIRSIPSSLVERYPELASLNYSTPPRQD
jgi:uncharacterized protein YecE (DUF72 family)